MSSVCRYVTQGMVKSSTNDVYWEVGDILLLLPLCIYLVLPLLFPILFLLQVMSLRRRMACARLGFES